MNGERKEDRQASCVLSRVHGWKSPYNDSFFFFLISELFVFFSDICL